METWPFGFWRCFNVKTIDALLLIDDLQNEWYKPPTSYYNQKIINFEFQSYKYSAINEIKLYLKKHENKDPISAAEEFRYKMDCFASETKNGNANFMFSIYYDVATDVLDVLLSSI